MLSETPLNVFLIVFGKNRRKIPYQIVKAILFKLLSELKNSFFWIVFRIIRLNIVALKLYFYKHNAIIIICKY